MPDPSTMGQALAGTVRGGSTTLASNAGHNVSPGSGPNRVSGGPLVPPAQAQRMAQGLTPQRRTPPPPPPTNQPQQYSAHNPQMMVQAPPTPHPGLAPPYPDARSPQPTMMANGQAVMPPPTGFMQPNTPPRVPATFIPGMTGLLGRLR
jgi:hypothetical protein